MPPLSVRFDDLAGEEDLVIDEDEDDILRLDHDGEEEDRPRGTGSLMCANGLQPNLTLIGLLRWGVKTFRDWLKRGFCPIPPLENRVSQPHQPAWRRQHATGTSPSLARS